MASNKFSRPVPVQQPPPVCRKPPPPGGPPPPPPHGPTLYLIATYDGLTLWGNPLDVSIDVTLIPDLPNDTYEYTGFAKPALWVHALFNRVSGQNYEWSIHWVATPEGTAWSNGHVDLPDAQPVDSGTIDAESTTPAGQTATIHAFTLPL